MRRSRSPLPSAGRRVMRARSREFLILPAKYRSRRTLAIFACTRIFEREGELRKQLGDPLIGEPKSTIDARVIETPGHTLGHIAYYFGDDEIVFVGDTLFSLGCGRVFEGTMDMMHLTLEALANLPGETQVYCGHEYTQANAKFALTVDPENSVLRERAQTVADLRKEGKFTLPTTIALENATNPFLRVEDPSVKAAMGMQDADPFAVFAAMRERKNSFAA